ncbi:MAG: helix-turn-helix domain-containing protein [Deltaproteobacteria bacterium]|nr:helix-turn-helix domain-containing protein [Deltaproteobacteria bacterium]
MKQQVFSIKNAATILDVHPDTIRRAIKAKKLKAAKIGRDYKIAKSELDRYFQAMGGTSLFGSNDTESQ